jgi:hypothetical protein
MKNLPRTIKYLLVIVALIAIVACAALVQSKKGGVKIDEYGVEITPEAKVSANDWNTINSILKKYRKSLYRIQTFKNGNLTGTRGALDEKYMRGGLVSEVAKAAEATQFNGSAIQLAFTSSTKRQPPPPPPPPTELEQAKKLMAEPELRTILERYSTR